MVGTWPCQLVNGLDINPGNKYDIRGRKFSRISEGEGITANWSNEQGFTEEGPLSEASRRGKISTGRGHWDGRRV